MGGANVGLALAGCGVGAKANIDFGTPLMAVRLLFGDAAALVKYLLGMLGSLVGATADAADVAVTIVAVAVAVAVDAAGATSASLMDAFPGMH